MKAWLIYHKLLGYQCECDGLPRQVLDKITEARNLQAVKIRKMTGAWRIFMYTI